MQSNMCMCMDTHRIPMHLHVELMRRILQWSPLLNLLQIRETLQDTLNLSQYTFDCFADLETLSRWKSEYGTFSDLMRSLRSEQALQCFLLIYKTSNRRVHACFLNTHMCVHQYTHTHTHTYTHNWNTTKTSDSRVYACFFNVGIHTTGHTCELRRNAQTSDFSRAPHASDGNC